jgi:hypothetical protein
MAQSFKETGHLRTFLDTLPMSEGLDVQHKIIMSEGLQVLVDHPKSGSIGGFYGTGIGSSRDLRSSNNDQSPPASSGSAYGWKSRCFHRSLADRPHGGHL